MRVWTNFSILIVFISSLIYSGKVKAQVDTVKANYSQDIITPIDVRFFKNEILADVFLKELNKRLKFKNKNEYVLDELLTKAALDHAEFISEIEDYKAEQSGKKEGVGGRVEFYGGSTKAGQLIAKISAKKGTDYLSYLELAEEVIFKWLGSTRTADVLEDPKYTFMGFGASFDRLAKRLYVCAVLGNYESYNEGTNRINELSVPYTDKKRPYGLKARNSKKCRKSDRFEGLVDLQKGLFVKDGYVYFKYDDLRKFKRLMNDPKDMISADIVQKEQFPCVGANIVNNSHVNKGVMLKPLKSKKIFKKNLIKGRRVKKVEVKVGRWPSSLTGDMDNYELNLVVIEDKYVCHNIQPSYVLDGGVEYKRKLEILADTAKSVENYNPSVTASVVDFRVPFERSKVDYKQEDVEPIIKQLNEPNFIINEVTVKAYSSVEGNAEKNAMLQKKRAESIINVLKSRQKEDLKTEVITEDNLVEFKRDIAGTKWENMMEMNLEEIQEHIRIKKLHTELEPILSKHRYADVEMNVIFDIEGEKEQPFVVSRFNKAVARGDNDRALSIQKYIIKKVLAKEYDEEAITGMEIPEKTSTAGLLMNKLWLSMKFNEDNLDEDYCERIGKFSALDPANPYITFNNVYCEITHSDIGDEMLIKERQRAIDELYNTTLSKEIVDKLNLEYQFKIIRKYDSLATPHPVMLASLEKVKEIVAVEETNWQSALKLAYIFINQYDYEFAVKLLEPFIDEEYVFEELLFTYISLCSKSKARMYSNKFSFAMHKAKELNQNRFCELFKDNKLPRQTFINTAVKKEYCETCK